MFAAAVWRISAKLQSQTSFLCRTAPTVDYYLATSSDAPPDPEMIGQVRRTGVARSPDRKYVLLVAGPMCAAWAATLLRIVWQLQQIATATFTTGMAFGFDMQAYVVAPYASFAIPVSPGGIDSAANLDAGSVTACATTLRAASWRRQIIPIGLMPYR